MKVSILPYIQMLICGRSASVASKSFRRNKSSYVATRVLPSQQEFFCRNNNPSIATRVISLQESVVFRRKKVLSFIATKCCLSSQKTVVFHRKKVSSFETYNHKQANIKKHLYKK